MKTVAQKEFIEGKTLASVNIPKYLKSVQHIDMIYGMSQEKGGLVKRRHNSSKVNFNGGKSFRFFPDLCKHFYCTCSTFTFIA